MAKIKMNGMWIIEDIEIKEEVRRAFQLMLSIIGNWRPSLSGLSFKRLNDLELSGLERPFTEEEMYGVLSSFSGIKLQAQKGSPWRFGSFRGSL